MIPTIPEEPGKRKALILTVSVHLLLVAFLFFGVQWKRSHPEVVEVELWSARPAPAVAPPPEPVPEEHVAPKPAPLPEPKPEPKVEPRPAKPDIALKEEKKPPKPEPKKPEPKPEPKKPEPKPEPKPEVKPAPRMPDFAGELKREASESAARSNAAQAMANAAAAESESRAGASKRGLADYAAKIRGKIRGNIVLPPSLPGNPEATFEVNQMPNGEVVSVRLKRSSGNAGLDAAIERAILKSSPLPKPDDPGLFQRVLEIKYRPLEE